MAVLPAAVLHAPWNVAAKEAGGEHRCTFIVAARFAAWWAQMAQMVQGAPARELSMLPAAPAPG